MVVTAGIVAGVASDLGIGVAAHALYDALKGRLGDHKLHDRKSVEAEIQNVMTVHGVDIKAATVVDMLAERGVLQITGSNIHAPDSVIFGVAGGEAYFGDNSLSSTDKTAIHAKGVGSGISARGHAAVRQNPDGSISFHVGQGGSVGFHVREDGQGGSIDFHVRKDGK
jgi:hypothetical protein